MDNTPSNLNNPGTVHHLDTFPMDDSARLLQKTAPNETIFYGAHSDVEKTEIGSEDQSRSTIRSVRPENSQASQDSVKGKRTFLVFLKGFIGAALFVVVLLCSAASKVTLVSLTGRLGCATANVSAGYCSSGSSSFSASSRENVLPIRLYWYLLFVISMPNIVTFVRSTAFGVLGKTRKNFPWPQRKAVFRGLLSSAFEATAITVVVYVVLPVLPPDIAILTLNGVFAAQIATDIYATRKCCWNLDSPPKVSNKRYKKVASKLWYWIGRVLEFKLTKVMALTLQIGAVVTLAIYCGIRASSSTQSCFVALPLSLVVLSIVWSNRVQEYIAKAWKSSERNNAARYKSSFINSFFRFVLYPPISCAVFFAMYRVNPWSHRNIVLDSPELAELLTQILASLLAYVFAWVSCVMMLNQSGLTLPLFLATPVSLAWYYLNLLVQSKNYSVFPHFETTITNLFDGGIYPTALCIAAILWISQLLGMVYYTANKTNIILAEDSEMFLTPHYDGVFLEQHTILNRQTKKNVSEQRPSCKEQSNEPQPRKPRHIFICSTMFRENDTEMKQMLTSIFRIARHREDRKFKKQGVDKYESHIFFDGSINGTQLQPFALQLIALLEDTLRIKLEKCLKTETPYGYQLTWSLDMYDDMKFTIHLKDKNKVKPKKRWSQVMYMNYIINHRIKVASLDPNDTFILTTDADIDFTAESAVVLLDMLASNEQVGAVSARTHPKGSGPLYWYQVFDYAIGHWFMKPAEHIFGCVLCSPGCFSVFRCKALNDVIAEYATDVNSAPEFLTKDMGEDRWLCTLLIKKGWRLEYCAISQDQTYVPESFSEFYKQRRRWIPSTVANLGQLISEAGSITRNNDTISYPFILFQALMIFSTSISPGTVILIVATGLQSAYQLDAVATIVVLMLVSVLYGIVCLTASPKAQIDVAKLLTFIFAVIMAIVIVGIFRDTVFDIFPDPKPTLLRPADCSLFTHTTNNSREYDDCIKNSRYIGSLVNSTGSQHFKLPVSMTTIYLGIFAATFTLAAILHLPEWSCLIHFIWYLLALPSGYLFLLIYSAANLNSQSWGTREESNKTDKGLLGWAKYFKMAWKKAYNCCRRNPENAQTGGQEESVIHNDSSSPSEAGAEALGPTFIMIEHKQMDIATKDWLTELDCERYVSNFEEHGYTNKHYISAMNMKDFEAIGIDKRGFRLRLEKAAKKLPSLLIDIDIPRDVEKWLEDLEMEEYVDLFRSEGYKCRDDIENLKDLSEVELVAIGVHKRAHLQRLKAALNRLFYPMPIELLKRNTKARIEKIPTLLLGHRENQFWRELIEEKLKPVTVRFTQVDDLKENLRSLRNMTLVLLLLVNIIWIILLHTLKFDRLAIFSFDPRVFQLLFIAVYGFIIVIQFVAMVCHRCVTLIHYLGRVKGEDLIEVEQQGLLELTLEPNA